MWTRAPYVGEAAADLGDHEVATGERHVGVPGVDLPGPGGGQVDAVRRSGWGGWCVSWSSSFGSGMHAECDKCVYTHIISSPRSLSRCVRTHTLLLGSGHGLRPHRRLGGAAPGARDRRTQAGARGGRRRAPISWYDVLLVLNAAPDRRLRMSDLGARAVLSREQISRVVSELEREGWSSGGRTRTTSGRPSP